MADIFISYKSEDRSAAQLLAGSLKDSGFSVWFDQGLGGDTPFHEQIAAELAAASAVVALWSRRSLDSRWVYSEANEADMHRKLINARIDDTLPPKPLIGSLRTTCPFGMGIAQIIDFKDCFATSVA